MNALLESLTKSLTEQGWKVEMQENNQIPAEIAQRYDSLPTDYRYFLQNMKACVNSAETVWLNLIELTGIELGGQALA